MIFCCTRNSSMTTAKELAKLWSTSNPPARHWKGPSRSLEVHNVDLKSKSYLVLTYTGSKFLLPYSHHCRRSRFPPCWIRPWRQTYRRDGVSPGTHKHHMLHLNTCSGSKSALSSSSNQEHGRLARRRLQRVLRPGGNADARTRRSSSI